jgi:hypothetical protein
MDDQDDILHIAKYFLGRYGAAAAALMESRARACDHDGDRDAGQLWRCVAAQIRKVQQAESVSAGRTERLKLIPDSHVRFAFEATPHPYLLLTPDLRIAGVNNCYLDATMTRRDDIMGREVFEALPDNPGWNDADGVRNFSASLARVIDRGAPDRMRVHRYDVRRPDGKFEERWWTSLNTPAFDAEGRLVLIVHHTQELKSGTRGRA